ncbi:MAG: lactate utilization protein [Verrucomicrobia bacterium]|nr:lactate utilization protein [Verrucomicrobiota bacterium]
MSAKNEILGRIREALREPAPVPGHHGDHGKAQLHASAEFSQWLPAVGEDLASQLDLFAKNSADLKTEFHLLASREEFAPRLRELAQQNNWKRVATHSGALTDMAVPAIGLPTLKTDAGYEVNAMEQCDAGITECDALVAQTGSILITSRSAGGRALSVLPPHHVVLVTRAQMVPDLAAAYVVVREKHGDKFPSFISFITGPSRTGDIERILVLGAHGPKRLTVFCC